MVKGIRKRKKMYAIQQNKVKERKNEDEEFMFWSPKLKKQDYCELQNDTHFNNNISKCRIKINRDSRYSDLVLIFMAAVSNTLAKSELI